MDKSTIKAGLVIALIAAVLTVGLLTVFRGDQAPIAAQSNSGKPLGALAGPDIPFQYIRVGGLAHYYYAKALATATTSPCVITSPAATSTLIRSNLIITTASSTATTWYLANGGATLATTTLLQNAISLSSGVQGTLTHVASSTYATVDTVDVFGPSTNLVWNLNGVNATDATKLNGFCTAEFSALY